MSDYGWFVVKCLGYLALIGFVCWWASSAWPLLALLLMPSWSKSKNKDSAI